MYLTPARFRLRDLGVDLSSFTDYQLATKLKRAADAIHDYTAAPTLPVPHDFRGGTITGETHTWRVDPYENQPTRRVFLFHRPVLEILTSRIYATATQYVEFSASELYYELSEGWYEPASANLTSYGLWGAATFPFIGLSQPHSHTDYRYGRRIPIEERIYYSEEGPFTWRATAGYWSTDVGDEPVVKVNGVTRPDTDYTIDFVEGTVTFVANKPVDGDNVDVEYTTTLHPDIADAEGIIAALGVAERPFVATMGGLRRLTVAELTMERSTSREGGGQEAVVVPAAAAELLEPFVFRSVAFA